MIRHSGDYDDFVYCDKEMADEYTRWPRPSFRG